MTLTDLKVYGLNSTALVASTQEVALTPNATGCGIDINYNLYKYKYI